MTDQDTLIRILQMGQESLSPDKYDKLEEAVLWIALMRVK